MISDLATTAGPLPANAAAVGNTGAANSLLAPPRLVASSPDTSPVRGSALRDLLRAIETEAKMKETTQMNNTDDTSTNVAYNVQIHDDNRLIHHT
jgi:hypothetical protein